LLCKNISIIMKKLKRILNIALISLLGLIIATCQKEDTLSENQMLLGTDIETENNSHQLKSTNSVSSYLLDLISAIETMESEGFLNKGIANSLIVKLKNALKSIDTGSNKNATTKSTKTNFKKDSPNAFNGQMSAFINQIEALMDNNLITIDQGQELIDKAESAVILYEGKFVDPRDGYEYSVVQIGDQLWMAENLRATKFNDGADIQIVTDNNVWSTLTTPGYCWYKNDYDTYGTIYGALYNWYTVNTGKLCPTGWHVPTDEDWTILIDYSGGIYVAGNKLKEAGTSHWYSPNTGATNETGFTALPGGLRSAYDGGFYQIPRVGFWWSIMEYNSTFAWNYYLCDWESYIIRNSLEKADGLSVRCIKD
jgi:uncharacterized protein (TIGR02145 family)